MMGAWRILMRAPTELAGMTLVSKGRAGFSRANLIGMLERSQVVFHKSDRDISVTAHKTRSWEIDKKKT